MTLGTVWCVSTMIFLQTRLSEERKIEAIEELSGMSCDCVGTNFLRRGWQHSWVTPTTTVGMVKFREFKSRYAKCAAISNRYECTFCISRFGPEGFRARCCGERYGPGESWNTSRKNNRRYDQESRSLYSINLDFSSFWVPVRNRIFAWSEQTTLGTLPTHSARPLGLV